MSNRDEILANFQAFTGIDDFGEAISCLEEANWNLMDAVYKILPHGSQDLPAGLPDEDSVEIIGEVGATANNIEQRFQPLPSTHSSQPPQLVSLSNDFLGSRNRGSRILNFRINYNETYINLKVPECETVETIKSLIHAELEVPPCRQELSGWKSNRPPRDANRLDLLNLPRDNVLYLSLKGNSEEKSSTSDEASRRTTQIYQLNIFDETHHCLHKVNFPGTKTILEIKNDIFDLTNIAVRHQYWSGWPSQVKDEMLLSASGVNFPVHNLTVSEMIKEINRPTVVPAQQAGEHVSDDGSTADEYEDASDVVMEDMFIYDSVPQRPRSLMPEGIEDEAIAAIHFAEGFDQRYGHCHPMFFQGSLDDAMKESVLQPAKDRKLLAVYLHHDGSVSSNVFCTQVLCSESVVSFLSNNFVIWGWDLTLQTNRTQLLNTIARHFDSVAASTLRSIDVDKLPLLLIVTRSRATNEVLTVIQGSVNVDEMMTQLLHAVEMFSEQQRVEISEEEEREAREQVKREQDEAYLASLQADRAKEELRKQEELEKQRAEQEKRLKEQHEELKRLEAQLMKEERRKQVESRLPPEPHPDLAEVSTTIRFRLPGGNTATRRFLATQTLQDLLDFLLVKGYPTEDFKVLSSWPRKDLTSLDSAKTLRELNLVPQETLIIEER